MWITQFTNFPVPKTKRQRTLKITRGFVYIWSSLANNFKWTVITVRVLKLWSPCVSCIQQRKRWTHNIAAIKLQCVLLTYRRVTIYTGETPNHYDDHSTPATPLPWHRQRMELGEQLMTKSFFSLVISVTFESTTAICLSSYQQTLAAHHCGMR